MAETAIAAICVGAAAAGGWLIYRGFRTGQSPGIYPFADSTRHGNPILFWFDMGLTILALALGAVAAVMVFLQGI
jgi:hypothetical protein